MKVTAQKKERKLHNTIWKKKKVIRDEFPFVMSPNIIVHVNIGCIMSLTTNLNRYRNIKVRIVVLMAN